MTRCQSVRLFDAAGLAHDGECLIDLAQSRVKTFADIAYTLCLTHLLEYAMRTGLPEAGYCAICYEATRHHSAKYCELHQHGERIAERAVRRAMRRVCA